MGDNERIGCGGSGTRRESDRAWRGSWNRDRVLEEFKIREAGMMRDVGVLGGKEGIGYGVTGTKGRLR